MLTLFMLVNKKRDNQNIKSPFFVRHGTLIPTFWLFQKTTSKPIFQLLYQNNKPNNTQDGIIPKLVNHSSQQQKKGKENGVPLSRSQVAGRPAAIINFHSVSNSQNISRGIAGTEDIPTCRGIIISNAGR